MYNDKLLSKTTSNSMNVFKEAKEQSIHKRFPSINKNRKNLILDNNNEPFPCIYSDPPEVLILNVEKGKLYEIPVRIINKVTHSVKVVIRPPKNNYFKVDYERKNSNNQISPGLYLELLVIFEPEALEDYYDKIEIIADNGYILNLDLKANKSQPRVIFDPFINFGFVPVNSKRTAKILFHNEGPKGTDIELKYVNPDAVDYLTFTYQKFYLSSISIDSKSKKSNRFEVVVVYDARDNAKNLNEIIEVYQMWDNSLLGTIELIATSIVQQLAIVFEDGGGTQTDINFGTMYYGQQRESKAFLVNNGSKEVNFKLIFHQNKKPSQLKGNLDDSDYICSPYEAGKEMIDRIINVNPLSGLIQPYSQIPILFSCITKVPEIGKGFRGYMDEQNQPLKDKYGNENTAETLMIKTHYTTVVVKFKEPKDKNLNQLTKKQLNLGDEVDLMCENLSIGTSVKLTLPEITFDKNILNFWECDIHEQKTIKIKITNKNDDLPIDFKFSKVSHFTVCPDKGVIKSFGDFVLVNINFHPENYGKFEDNIVFKYVRGMYEYPIKVLGFCQKKNSKIRSAIPNKVRGPEATKKDFINKENIVNDNLAMNYTLPKLGAYDKSKNRLQSKEIRMREDRIEEMIKNKCNDEIIDNFIKKYEDYKKNNEVKIEGNNNIYFMITQRKIKEREKTARTKRKEIQSAIPLKSETAEKLDKNDNDKFETEKTIREKENKDSKDTNRKGNTERDNNFANTLKEIVEKSEKEFRESNLLDKLTDNFHLEEPKFVLPKNKDTLYVTKAIGKYKPQRENDNEIKNYESQFNPDIPAREKVLQKPVDVKEKNECKAELDGFSLLKIEVGPKEIDFGDVFRKSCKQKTLWMKNNLKSSIIVNLIDLDDGDLVKTKIRSIVIKPDATEGFNLIYYSDEVRGKITFSIKYTINYIHSFKMIISANVIYPNLTILENLVPFNFNSQSRDPIMIYKQVMKLENRGNDKVSFNFDPLKYDKYFTIEPTSGEVQPGSKFEVNFTFDPKDYKSRNEVEDETKINYLYGGSQLIKLRGSVPPSEVIIDSGNVVDFGFVHQGVRETKTIVLKNTKPGITAFKFENEDNFVRFEPGQDVVDQRKANVLVHFKSGVNLKFEKTFKIFVRGGSTLEITIKANVIVPDVRILQTNFDFGTASYGEEKIQTMTFKNFSEIQGIIRVDLTIEKYKCFKLRLHEQYKGSKNHLVVNLHKDDEDLNKQEEIDDKTSVPSKLYVDEDDIKNNLRFFEIVVPPGEELNFEFIFIPSPEITKKAYDDLYTNFEIKGLTVSEFNPALHKKIIAQQIQSRINIHPEKVVFDKTFLVKSQQNYSDTIMKIFNHCESIQKWKLDTSKTDPVFKISEKMGEILPQSSIDIRFKFLPEVRKQYESTFLILLQNEKGVYEKTKEVTITGEGAHPRIYFDRKELVFPIVPLGVESSLQFKIFNEGFESTPLNYKFDSDMGVLPIKLKWIEGTNLIGILRNELNCELSFINNKPLCFTCKLVFADYEGDTFSILVAGITENSLLTSYSFISNYPEYSELYKDPNNNSINLKILDQIDVKSDELINTESSTNKELIKKKFIQLPPKRNKTQTLKVNSYLLNLMNHILTTNISSFPDSLSHIANKGEYLQEFISILSGKKDIPGKITKPSNDYNQQVIQQRQMYLSILKFLQEHGASLNTIFPEYLLDFNSYKKYMKLDPNSNKILPPNWEQTTSIFTNHKNIHLESWTHLIYQIIKIFYLCRVNSKSFSKIISVLPSEITASEEKEKILPSNIYSNQELMLLKWLKLNYLTGHISGSSKQRDFYNFKDHIIESGVLFNLSLNYFPKDDKHSIKRIKQTDQKVPSGERIISALKEFGVYTHASAEDINNGYPRELLCLCLFLYQNLIFFVPKGTIEFSCILGDVVKKAILLENNASLQSGKKVEYLVRKEGSTDFDIKDSNINIDTPTDKEKSSRTGKIYNFGENLEIRLDTSEKIEFLVSFRSRISTEVKGRIYFLNKNVGFTYQAAPIVYDLVSKVTGRRSFGDPILIKSCLYKKEEVKIPIKSPFKIKGDFSILPLEVKRKNPIPKPKKQYGTVNKKQEEKHDDIIPSVFILRNPDAQIRFDSSDSKEISLYFCPIDFEPYLLNMIFINESIGEFQISIEGQAELPDFSEVIEDSCYVDEMKEISININFQNKFLKSALEIIYQNEYKKENQEIIEKMIKNNLNLNKITFGVESTKQYFLTTSIFSIEADEINTINNTKSLKTNEKMNIQPTSNTSAIMPLIVKFSSKSCDTYEGEIILKNSMSKLVDVRVFKIILTVRPKNIFSKLVFNCPVGQQIVQKIPILNNSECDWIIKVELINNDAKHAYFSGPQDKKISKKSTESYPLTYFPLEKFSTTGKLILRNTFTKEYYEYELKGNVDDPLAEGLLEIFCNAYEERKTTVQIDNIYDYDLNYEVETDLTDVVTGLEKFCVRARNHYKYEITTKPLLGKIYFGKITFKDDKGFFKWYTIKIDAKSITQNETLELKTQIRKAIYIQLVIENPTNKTKVFNCDFEGPFLKGDSEIKVEANKKINYILYFEPYKVGKWEGIIHIYNETAGEYLYKLKLISEESTIIYPDTIQSELGKSSQSSILLENPTKQEIVVLHTNSNPSHFKIKPDKITLLPESYKEILVTFTPSNLEYEEICTLLFESYEIGKWEYRLRGKGLFPTIMDTTKISTFVGGIISGGVTFKNPTNEKITITLELKCDEWPNTFRLMLKNNKIVVDPGKSTFINFSFAPSKLITYKAEMIVYISKNLFWRYPIEGITEVRSKGIDYIFRTKAKKSLENKVVIDLTDVPDSVNIEDLEMTKKVKEEKYKKLVDKCMLISMDNPKPKLNGQNEEEVQLSINTNKKINLIVKFLPLRPFKTELELIIIRKKGGQWVFNLLLEALEPDPEDNLIVKSSLGKTSTFSFRLNNLFTRPANFITFFTHDSSSEFSILPKEGILEANGK